MLSNYLKIAFRNIAKNKIYSIINVSGLALGVAVFFITLLYTTHQLSWYNFHSKGADLYRIHQKFNDGGTTARISYPIKEALKSDYSYVEEATSFTRFENRRVFIDGAQKVAENIFFVEPSFFDLFDVSFVNLSKETVKNQFEKNANQALITEEYARVLFGNTDVIGKTFVEADDQEGKTYAIAGLIKEFPENSHFQFSILVPMISNSFIKNVEDNWNNPVVYTYVYIPDKTKAQQFSEQKTLDEFISRHFPEKFGGPEAHLPVIPMYDVHLHSHLYYDMESNSDIVLVYIVNASGILILILACINFMNLTTARATRRAKEVGMRKSLGATKQHLVQQFLGEAIIFSLIAVMIGILLAELFLPSFNKYLEENLAIQYFDTWYTIPLMILIGVTIGVFSGLYPAFVLSSFQPASILKQTQSNSLGGFLIRKGLVIFQFIIVTLLLVSIITMKQQLAFMASKDLGYDYKNLVYVRSSDKMDENPDYYKSFVNELRAGGLIEQISGVSNWSYQTIQYEDMKPNERKGGIIMTAGPDYPEAMGIKLASGRFPIRDNKTDRNAIIFNETAIADLDWDSESALGKEVSLYEGDSVFRVIGVVKDFHLEDLTTKIENIAIIPDPSEYYPVSMLRISESKKEEALTSIKQAWMRFDDGWPFEIYSGQNEVEKSYESIHKIQDMMSDITYLGILIACMGLYGLASFTAERKTKEIGIRKVLGAKVFDIWRLVISEFSYIVLIATAIGLLIGYFVSDMLLQNFAYRIAIGLSIFASATLLSIAIAIFTVSYQAFKSALINPVDTLKIE